ncbi:MAG: glycosyltransferase [Acidobacteria bacterium]|nr:glycosyltransferase [Acidobacteriota bacterium]
MSPMSAAPLTVALVAGGLGQGGAEKQLLYMARALVQQGVRTRCYCLTRGDHYESHFRDAGVEPIWIGQQGAPPIRVARLARHLRRDRADIVQAGHFFANLYAALGARACGAASIGAVRNDGALELRENRGWGPWLTRLPTILMANSEAGARHVRTYRQSADEVVVLPNVIDLARFDALASDADGREPIGPVAMAVGRLVPAKRFELFLAALAMARQTEPALTGVIVGDGPERARLEDTARRLNLLPDAVRFAGARSDVPALLRQAHFLVSSSAHEGFPNVLLEAMAAGRPVITTPAGDAERVIDANVTGLLIPGDDAAAMAAAMVDLARHPATRQAMGREGRRRVERLYSDHSLADRLLAIYDIARARRRRVAVAAPAERPVDIGAPAP